VEITSKRWVGLTIPENIIFCFVAIKGWNSNQPAHSCKDIRDSGDSKGDGEYWIDPEKSGNPLKVFCDMITDGGSLMIMKNNIFLGGGRRGEVGFWGLLAI